MPSVRMQCTAGGWVAGCRRTAPQGVSNSPVAAPGGCKTRQRHGKRRARNGVGALDSLAHGAAALPPPVHTRALTVELHEVGGLRVGDGRVERGLVQDLELHKCARVDSQWGPALAASAGSRRCARLPDSTWHASSSVGHRQRGRCYDAPPSTARAAGVGSAAECAGRS